VECDNPGEKLKPGASVHVKIITELVKNATTVPSSAILPGEEGGTAVLVIDSDSIAHRHVVTTGIREGDKVQILNGARPGDEVVVVGGLGVDDKAKVRRSTPPCRNRTTMTTRLTLPKTRHQTRRKTRPSRKRNERPFDLPAGPH
jgi:multidrug efflux pump subunit AcrA (membrane-fusion protein)